MYADKTEILAFYKNYEQGSWQNFSTVYFMHVLIYCIYEFLRQWLAQG